MSKVPRLPHILGFGRFWAGGLFFNVFAVTKLRRCFVLNVSFGARKRRSPEVFRKRRQSGNRKPASFVKERNFEAQPQEKCAVAETCPTP